MFKILILRSSFLPHQPFSVVITATTTRALMAVLMFALIWIYLGPVEAVRKDVSVTLASNSVEESVSQQRIVAAGLTENTTRLVKHIR